jgi:transposase-like protein
MESKKISSNTYKLYINILQFPFETCMFEKYLNVEKAILTTVAESYPQDISTRRMEKIIKSQLFPLTLMLKN